MDLGGKMISFQSIEQVHHIYTMKYGIWELSKSDKQSIDHNFDHVLHQNPSAIKEYRFLLKCISLVSSLMIKWGLVAVEEYKYRL